MEGTNPFVIMNSRLHADPRPFGEAAPDVPQSLQAVVGKALKREPSRRYYDATEFAYYLEHPGEANRLTRTPSPERPSRVLFYSAVTAIPIAVLGMLCYVALHP